MRSSDEPTVFELSRRRAGDAWAPERVESKKPGGAAKLDTISVNITIAITRSIFETAEFRQIGDFSEIDAINTACEMLGRSADECLFWG